MAFIKDLVKITVGKLFYGLFVLDFKGRVMGLAKRFSITFSDLEVMEFFDILTLEDKQINEILEIASQNTKWHFRNETKGIDISYLTATQKQRILISKDRVVYGRSIDDLRSQGKVLVTLHSQKRILERIGSNKGDIIIDIIQRIVEADKVLKAQFKGYSSLAYTLTKRGDPKYYKLPISFKWVDGKRKILSVTVTHKNASPSTMTTRLDYDDDLVRRMEEFKRRLVERSNKNK